MGWRNAHPSSFGGVAYTNGTIRSVGVGYEHNPFANAIINSSYAMKINGDDDVVGVMNINSTPVPYVAGFVWRDGRISALTDLVREPGWSVTAAYGINDSGEIVGGAMERSTGRTVAVVLTPEE